MLQTMMLFVAGHLELFFSSYAGLNSWQFNA